jgi:hypothetical protein
MIIGDLNVKSVSVFPTKADSVLIVDTDAPLSSPVALQGFKPVCGRRREIAQFVRAIDLNQPAKGHRGDLLETPHSLLSKDSFGIFVPERADQTNIILRSTLNAFGTPEP